MTPTNNDLQPFFNESVKPVIIPRHKCKKHLRIKEEFRSYTPLHYIVIARKYKCNICGKIFQYNDPNGLD